MFIHHRLLLFLMHSVTFAPGQHTLKREYDPFVCFAYWASSCPSHNFVLLSILKIILNSLMFTPLSQTAV